jgi:hypothetical protein
MSLSELITLHTKELPFFARHWVERREFITAVVKANPDIPLGGLPVAAKDTRFGSGSHFLATQRLQNSESARKFIKKHAPVVSKPLYGSQSRNISIHKDTTSPPSGFSEPMLLQDYHPGREYAVCLAYYENKLEITSVVEIFAEGDIWGGKGSYADRTADCQTSSIKKACQSVCEQAGLQFGRLDVKADSLGDLKSGNFNVMEVNGSTAIDMRIYTDAPQNQKREWLSNHWQRMFNVADSHEKNPDVPWGLLGQSLSFALFPSLTVRVWSQLK